MWTSRFDLFEHGGINSMYNWRQLLPRSMSLSVANSSSVKGRTLWGPLSLCLALIDRPGLCSPRLWLQVTVLPDDSISEPFSLTAGPYTLSSFSLITFSDPYGYSINVLFRAKPPSIPCSPHFVHMSLCTQYRSRKEGSLIKDESNICLWYK